MARGRRARYPAAMNRIVWCLLLAACGGPLVQEDLAAHPATDSSYAAAESDDALPPSGELRSAYDLTIASGKHHSNHDFIARPHLGRHVDRELRFRAVFSANAAYTTQDPANQSDWNKLMGLTTNRIHKNSIRIGWRWNPATSRIELASYGYLDGARGMHLLGSVAPEKAVDCVLRMDDGGLYAQAGGASFLQAGTLGAAFPMTWVLHTAYFGGDETAPHRIDVQVTDISAR
jgi:hypothetical protein